MLALLNALDTNAVDVSYDCVRGTTFTNGTCAPQCSLSARVGRLCSCFVT